MGTGDWNDGMNRVGVDGKGESVWLGWLLARTVALFAPLAPDGEADRVQRWRDHVAALRAGIERHAWDGAWYRRATFDDGTWLGSQAGDECRIDSIAQSWAVLSGAADPGRAAMAMASLEHHLIRGDDGLALLFWPPFDQTALEPGYIKGYPPGLRENGGQYSHAGMWAIQAFAQLGEADTAARLFALLNPINHARTAVEANRYKVEPYVVAADVYSVPPHVGRGGWTWYTGAAGWMYRAGVEGILGISREGNVLVIAPRLPAAWPGYEAIVDLAVGYCRIVVTALADGDDAKALAILDGNEVACPDGHVRVPLDGGRHDLHLSL
jgi:cyclic beta-1,2-glucan synthetase